MIAEADTGSKLNLQQLAKALQDTEYDPARFPGLICHIKSPESAIIIFSSGKLVSTGGNNIERVHKALMDMLDKLREMGVNVDRGADVDVQNIIASHDLHKLLNLKTIAISIGKSRAEYDPDTFEALVYRLKGNPAITMLYNSGKILCSGTKKQEELEVAMNSLLSDLESTGLMS